MKNVIVGTAGHIDHGKTTLVRALTGIDTDRLKEEKRRGISIDLGFAHLEAGNIQFGFVDVPGHERFIKNMLAGVGGIDLIVLVVAADESIKPQTREHFDICRLLGLRLGLVALTKIDLAGPELTKLAALEVAEFVKGSFLEHAPIVPVSAATGEGLDELKTELVRIGTLTAQRDADGLTRLPVDRSFSIKGFGTVVTGTLISGRLNIEDDVQAYPAVTHARVRGVQVHGRAVTSALPGQRTAINLAGLETSQVTRGMLLGVPGQLQPCSAFDAQFDLLAGATPMKHRAPVHLHSGTAETEATVRLLESLDALQPGTSAPVRFMLKEPLVLLPGDRFIVRKFSPPATIGGGVVLDNAPPLKLRRTAVVARLKNLAADRLSTFVQEAKEGIAIDALPARLGWARAKVEAEAKRLQLIRIGELLVAPQAFAKASATLTAAVSEFHKKQPLISGLNRAQAPVPAAWLDALLAVSKEVAAEGEILRLKSHKLALNVEEAAALSKIEEAFRQGGLTISSTDEVLKSSGVDAVRARALLQMLSRQGKLIRVSADLICHTTALEHLREVLAHRKGTKFSVAEFKEWTGVSRKYAIPLLEYLDRERITRREGDQRRVL